MFRMNKTWPLFLIIIIACASPAEKKEKRAFSDILNNINGEPVVPRHANKIFLYPFENSTANITLSDKLAIRLKKLINMDGRLTVVKSVEISDLFFKGEIVTFSIQSLDFGTLARPVKKRLLIAARIGLVDNRLKKSIFNNSYIQSFYIFSDILPPVETEITAAEKALHQLAERMLSKIITGWYTDKMTRMEKGK